MEEKECCKTNSCENARTWTSDEERAVFEDKCWRQQLDGILQDIKAAERKSRERSILVTKIQEAIMWAGMDLKALNDGRTIYPDSYDPSNSYVAPTADGIKL